MISDKALQLVQFLATDENVGRSTIVFVERRATVAVLHKLLGTHPSTKDIVRPGTFIGTSNSSNRSTSLGDWLETSQQGATLDSFRLRVQNLVIATTVLEEGIDISACSVVICFSKPANLKSFIQRRGRAREQASTLVLMLSAEDEMAESDAWEALEREMVETYQKDAAERRAAQLLEGIEEHSEARFEVESTKYVYEVRHARPWHHRLTSPGRSSRSTRPAPIYIISARSCQQCHTWRCGQSGASAKTTVPGWSLEPSLCLPVLIRLCDEPCPARPGGRRGWPRMMQLSTPMSRCTRRDS